MPEVSAAPTTDVAIVHRAAVSPARSDCVGLIAQFIRNECTCTPALQEEVRPDCTCDLVTCCHYHCVCKEYSWHVSLPFGVVAEAFELRVCVKNTADMVMA